MEQQYLSTCLKDEKLESQIGSNFYLNIHVPSSIIQNSI